jgi:hypothetical protein
MERGAVDVHDRELVVDVLGTPAAYTKNLGRFRGPDGIQRTRKHLAQLLFERFG